jgi:hypothetical protein
MMHAGSSLIRDARPWHPRENAGNLYSGLPGRTAGADIEPTALILR